jgi:hypothetical protein
MNHPEIETLRCFEKRGVSGLFRQDSWNGGVTTLVGFTEM